MDQAREVQRRGFAGAQYLGKPALEPRTAVILAREQSRGRGREGRVWFSERDAGLYLSFLLDGSGIEEWGVIPLVIGVAVLHTTADYTSSLRLKWPNDVVSVDAEGNISAKLAGILCERFSSTWLNVGVGLNLFPQKEASGAVSLSELSAKSVKFPAAFAALSASIFAACYRLRREGFDPFYEQCEAAQVLRGRRISALSLGQRIDGVVSGITRRGSLLLEAAHGPVELFAGDIHIVDVR